MKTIQEWIKDAFAFYKKKNGIAVLDIIEFIDYKNHSRYTDKEILTELAQMKKKGEVVDTSDLWHHKFPK